MPRPSLSGAARCHASSAGKHRGTPHCRSGASSDGGTSALPTPSAAASNGPRRRPWSRPTTLSRTSRTQGWPLVAPKKRGDAAAPLEQGAVRDDVSKTATGIRAASTAARARTFATGRSPSRAAKPPSRTTAASPHMNSRSGCDVLAGWAKDVQGNSDCNAAVHSASRQMRRLAAGCGWRHAASCASRYGGVVGPSPTMWTWTTAGIELSPATAGSSLRRWLRKLLAGTGASVKRLSLLGSRVEPRCDAPRSNRARTMPPTTLGCRTNHTMLRGKELDAYAQRNLCEFKRAYTNEREVKTRGTVCEPTKRRSWESNLNRLTNTARLPSAAPLRRTGRGGNGRRR